MNNIEIKTFIEIYMPMMTLIEDTLRKLEKVNTRWCVDKGIVSTTIETYQDVSTINVTYNSSCLGQYSEDFTSFPAEWLLLSEEELIYAATKYNK
jgi:hypothetical protein